MNNLDILDDSGIEEPKKANDTLKIFSILSYVGNGLIGLIFLIAFFYFIAFIEAFKSAVPVADPTGVYLVLILVFLIIFALIFLCILGTYKMHMKLKKSGLVMYLIGNGLWVLLTLLGAVENPSNLIFALPSLAFCIVFILEMRKINTP